MSKEKIQIIVDLEIEYDNKKGRKEAINRSLFELKNWSMMDFYPDYEFIITPKKTKLIKEKI